jgi:hypothetical protein
MINSYIFEINPIVQKNLLKLSIRQLTYMYIQWIMYIVYSILGSLKAEAGELLA